MRILPSGRVVLIVLVNSVVVVFGRCVVAVSVAEIFVVGLVLVTFDNVVEDSKKLGRIIYIF